MQPPSSSVGLHQHTHNLRPIRVRLDGAALGEGLQVRACVGCGDRAPEHQIKLRVANGWPAWWVAMSVVLGMPALGIGCVMLCLELATRLWHDTGLSRGQAQLGAMMAAIAIFALLVGGVVVLLRLDDIRLAFGRCGACRARARRAVPVMAAIMGMLVVVPLAAAVGAIQSFKLLSDVAVLTLLSASATSLALCMLLHERVWQQRVFDVRAAAARGGVWLTGGPLLGEALRAEHPEAVTDVEVLGAWWWRKADA
jgi:hypothetical protein